MGRRIARAAKKTPKKSKKLWQSFVTLPCAQATRARPHLAASDAVAATQEKNV